MKELSRRIARLENHASGVVPQYVGMTLEDAMLLAFGAAGPPPGCRLVIVRNALPDPIS
jgi:hypothetical protein